MTIKLDWVKIEAAVDRLVVRQNARRFRAVYGVPRGGVVPALLVAQKLGATLVELPVPGCLVVDDLVDSGATLQPWVEQGFEVDALYRKPHSPSHLAPDATSLDGWLVFPWEGEEQGQPEDAVRRILQFIGEDPTREGLVETPARVLKAWTELTAGYRDDVPKILSKTFGETSDELVMVRDIPFVSLCEHHMLPFPGTATVAYLPEKRVVGLSKLARTVHAYARRLQVQERLTYQIAEAIYTNLDARGVGVIIRGHHTCMEYRGVRTPGEMVTSSLLGNFRTNDVLRAEFLSLEK